MKWKIAKGQIHDVALIKSLGTLRKHPIQNTYLLPQHGFLTFFFPHCEEDGLLLLPSMFMKSLLLLTLLVPSSTFAPTVPKCRQTIVSAANENAFDLGDEEPNSRRSFFANVVSTYGIMSVVSIPLPALAEVSQGNSLPDGAAQFKRLINLKSDIPVR